MKTLLARLIEPAPVHGSTWLMFLLIPSSLVVPFNEMSDRNADPDPSCRKEFHSFLKSRQFTSDLLLIWGVQKVVWRQRTTKHEQMMHGKKNDQTFPSTRSADPNLSMLSQFGYLNCMCHQCPCLSCTVTAFVNLYQNWITTRTGGKKVRSRSQPIHKRE